MLLVLLLLSWLAIFAAVLSFHDDHIAVETPRFRLVVIKAFLVFAMQCFALTEVLSAFNLIRTTPLVIAYLISIAVLSSITFWRRHQFCAATKQMYSFFRTRSDRFMVWAIATIVVVIFVPMVVKSLLLPPNTWDGMVYHLPRVEHWIQNHNVSHYPTTILRQLYVQPFAEYFILHVFLLNSLDSWANLVQFVALIGSLFTVSLIAQQFQLTARGQFLAVTLALATPMAVCQATGTQVDLIVSFFFLCICFFGIELMREEQHRLQNVVLFGMSLGLGAFSKATLGIFAIPFCVWFAFVYFRLFPKQWFQYATIVILLVLLTNGIYFYRNAFVSGHMLGDPAFQTMLRNEPICFSYTCSNIIRNVGAQLAVPAPSINASMDHVVKGLHDQFGLAWDSRNSTFGLQNYQTVFLCCESTVSAFTTLAFFIISIPFFFGHRYYAYLLQKRKTALVTNSDKKHIGKSKSKRKAIRQQQERQLQQSNVPQQNHDHDHLQSDKTNQSTAPPYRLAACYLVCLLVGFLLYNMILKWQPWAGRLMLPWFLGATPFIALTLSLYVSEKLKVILSWCCLGIALLILFLNVVRIPTTFHLGEYWHFWSEVLDDEILELQTTQQVDYPDGVDLAPYSSKNDQASLFVTFLHDRDYYYFYNRYTVMIGHFVLNEYLKQGHYQNIGIAFEDVNTKHDADHWEYPIIRLLRRDQPDFHIEFVGFPDNMKKTPNYDPGFVPEVIITDYTDMSPLTKQYRLSKPIHCGELRLYQVLEEYKPLPETKPQ